MPLNILIVYLLTVLWKMASQMKLSHYTLMPVHFWKRMAENKWPLIYIVMPQVFL